MARVSSAEIFISLSIKAVTHKNHQNFLFTFLCFQVAPRPSLSCLTSSLTADVIRQTNLTNVKAATNASLMKLLCWNIFPSTRSLSMSRPTSVLTVENPTPRLELKVLFSSEGARVSQMSLCLFECTSTLTFDDKLYYQTD